MDNDIMDTLEDLGYTGELLDPNVFNKAVDSGPKSSEFTQLIEWICKELKVICKLEETVNAIVSEVDSSNFLLELSSFLKELGCCYSSLLEGHLSERLNCKEKRLLLLDYLLTELMAARMVRTNKPQLNKGLELKLNESSTAADLKSMLITLKFSKPPDNVDPKMLFSKIEEKVQIILNETPSDLLGNALFKGKLSDKQWHALQEIHSELENEYFVRREMLIKRLDVTIQSFQWSDKAKKNENNIISSYHSHRNKLVVKPDVSLADLLAAREDLAIIEKTSNASVRKNTKSSVNKVIIGQVPDRGGRPNEQEAPPPEMPSWQKNRALGSGSSGGHGFGRVQGNWNHGQQHKERGDYKERGNYHGQGNNSNNRGGHRNFENKQSGRGGRRDYR